MSIFLRLNTLRLSCLNIKTQFQCRNISVSKSRNFLSTKFRRTGSSAEKERLLKLKDNVPESYALIYCAPMENYIFALKYMTTISAAVVTVLSCYKFMCEKTPQFYQVTSLGLTSEENDIYFFMAAFIGFTVVSQIMISKYPLRIYKNANNYLAIYDSYMPFRYATNSFQKGQVETVRNILNPWRDSMYRLGNKPSLVLLNYFKTPSEFHEMVGEDFKY